MALGSTMRDVFFFRKSYGWRFQAGRWLFAELAMPDGAVAFCRRCQTGQRLTFFYFTRSDVRRCRTATATRRGGAGRCNFYTGGRGAMGGDVQFLDGRTRGTGGRGAMGGGGAMRYDSLGTVRQTMLRGTGQFFRKARRRDAI